MKKDKRVYTQEFKQEAIRLLETSGKSAAQVERELGITPGLLSHWKRRQKVDGEQSFLGHDRLTTEQERSGASEYQELWLVHIESYHTRPVVSEQSVPL